MADGWAESLEEQLNSLESRVYGNEEVSKCYVTCIDRLSYFSGRFNSAVTGRDKINNALKRLEDIEKYLDPEYVDRVTLPDNAKLQLVGAEENNVRRTVALLEKLDELKPVLNSEHIKNTPNLTDQLLNLSQVQVKQRDQVVAFNYEVEPLIETYNAIIQTLTKQFVQWDDLVTKLEVQSQSKTTVQ